MRLRRLIYPIASLFLLFNLSQAGGTPPSWTFTAQNDECIASGPIEVGAAIQIQIRMNQQYRSMQVVLNFPTRIYEPGEVLGVRVISGGTLTDYPGVALSETTADINMFFGFDDIDAFTAAHTMRLVMTKPEGGFNVETSHFARTAKKLQKCIEGL